MIVRFFQLMHEDIQSVFDRDPAARSVVEILLTYPGLHAIWGYRITHWLWKHKIKLLARWLSTLFRWMTGVEIHPGASIGRKFFIDHGMGVVIGETAKIGDNVTLYHGVTLGGTSLTKGKRHPTLGNNVVVGAGAKILGAITIGESSRIGANAVVVKPTPPNAVVVGVPGQVVMRSKPRAADAPPDLNHGVMPDTIGLTIEDLMKRIERLETAVTEPKAEHPLASRLLQLEELEVRLSGHLDEHQPIPLNGHVKPNEKRNKLILNKQLPEEHHMHAPEHGVWRGEDFSI